MRAILEAFPGAKIDSVRDSRADAYGLLAEPASLGGEAEGFAGSDPEGPDFAPLDAEFVDDPTAAWEN